MTLYSKLTILMLSVCLCQCNYTFARCVSDTDEQAGAQSVAASAGQVESESLDGAENARERLSRDILRGAFAERRYDALSAEQREKVATWMREEEYEKAASYLVDLVVTKCESPELLWTSDPASAGANSGEELGLLLSLLSEALEYGGNFPKSQKIKLILFGSLNVPTPLIWQDARHEYSQGNLEAAFKNVCRAVGRNYMFWNLDDGLDQGEKEEVAKLRASGPELSEIEYEGVNRLKDECVRVICPNFHWKYGGLGEPGDANENRKIIALYDQYFQEFIKFVEDEGALLIDSPEVSKIFKDEYRAVVEQFRKLARRCE